MNIFKRDMDIICIGKALIDFFKVQSEVGFREVEKFRRIADSTPANVTVDASRFDSNVVSFTPMKNNL